MENLSKGLSCDVAIKKCNMRYEFEKKRLEEGLRNDLNPRYHGAQLLLRIIRLFSAKGGTIDNEELNFITRYDQISIPELVKADRNRLNQLVCNVTNGFCAEIKCTLDYEALVSDFNVFSDKLLDHVKVSTNDMKNSIAKDRIFKINNIEKAFNQFCVNTQTVIAYCIFKKMDGSKRSELKSYWKSIKGNNRHYENENSCIDQSWPDIIQVIDRFSEQLSLSLSCGSRIEIDVGRADQMIEKYVKDKINEHNSSVKINATRRVRL